MYQCIYVLQCVYTHIYIYYIYIYAYMYVYAYNQGSKERGQPWRWVDRWCESCLFRFLMVIWEYVYPMQSCVMDLAPIFLDVWIWEYAISEQQILCGVNMVATCWDSGDGQQVSRPGEHTELGSRISRRLDRSGNPCRRSRCAARVIARATHKKHRQTA